MRQLLMILLVFACGCGPAPPDDPGYIPPTIKSSVLINRDNSGIESAIITFPYTELGQNGRADSMTVYTVEEIDSLVIQLNHIIEQLELAKKNMQPAKLPDGLIVEDPNSESSHQE